ncbi:MAG: DUF721 domain-containing protein [Actinomycetota bacterium]|nr:DUF721 domain-containing protein [Actinomycetota bacterium]
MHDDPVQLKNVLPEATGRLGIPSPEATGRVWSAWKDIVGPAVAAHAEPTSLREGVLRVRADSPAWATEIGYLVEEIRSRANAVTGRPLVLEVRVWTGPRSTLPSTPGDSGTKGSVDPERESAQSPAEALDRARRAWAKRRRA